MRRRGSSQSEKDRRTLSARRRNLPPRPRRSGEPSGECTVPDPLTPAALEKVILKPPPAADVAEIRRYMEMECSDESVIFLERVASERLFDRRLDVWDVHTDAGRYWVITDPTNLYAQHLFPSLDFTLTVHVGVTTRALALRDSPPDEHRHPELVECWRRWAQASEAADRAEEAEDFQAVGMRCREVLLNMVRHLAENWMVSEDGEQPKAADFVHWSERVADGLAQGAGAERVRGYLKAQAKAGWDLVQWLTHSSNATRHDAELALEATRAVLDGFGRVRLRYERAFPDRCRRCSSYRVVDYVPNEEEDPVYTRRCESCGWIGAPRKQAC
jgi:hypothetical protein